jgi:hypothetical protein
MPNIYQFNLGSDTLLTGGPFHGLVHRFKRFPYAQGNHLGHW